MNHSKLTAICKSKLKDVTLSFSILFDEKEEPMETLGTDWIEEGLTEAFWENAELLKDTSVEQFGEFDITYELDGVNVAYPFEFDVNIIMEGLLI